MEIFIVFFFLLCFKNQCSRLRISTNPTSQRQVGALGRGSSGRVQVFHDPTYAQAFTKVHTRTHTHTYSLKHNTHLLIHIHTECILFLSPLGAGFFFSSQLSAASTPLSFVQKKAASIPGPGDYMFLHTLLLFFSYHLLLFYLF